MPHSVDFHAARVAPNIAFRDVDPGKSFTFSFKATAPGVFMYHCGTKPVLAHIANGMYGAIVVDPPAGTLPHADRQYVLVSSEWYLGSNGLKQPASLDMTKAHEMTPDWVTWNGYAAQYVKHPLTAMPGETVRFWVVDAGPSLNTAFHIVGTLLNRAWLNADMTTIRAQRPDGARPGRRRRRLRRQDRPARPVPDRLALLRERRRGPGRPAERRRRRRHDEPLSLATAT